MPTSTKPSAQTAPRNTRTKQVASEPAAEVHPQPKAPKGNGANRTAKNAGGRRQNPSGENMTATSFDTRAEKFKEQLEAALTGKAPAKEWAASKDYDTSNVYTDATNVASMLLANYISAAEVNPKGYKIASKDFVNSPQLQNVPDDKIWPLVWTAIEVLGPLVVDIATKDFKPQKQDLMSAIDSVPAHRRKDKDWVDYATTLALILAQGTVEVLGKKEFSTPGQYPTMPRAPRGADPAYVSDALKFATGTTKFLDFTFNF